MPQVPRSPRKTKYVAQGAFQGYVQGGVGKAVAPRRLGVMPRMVPKGLPSRALYMLPTHCTRGRPMPCSSADVTSEPRGDERRGSTLGAVQGPARRAAHICVPTRLDNGPPTKVLYKGGGGGGSLLGGEIICVLTRLDNFAFAMRLLSHRRFKVTPRSTKNHLEQLMGLGRQRI